VIIVPGSGPTPTPSVTATGTPATATPTPTGTPPTATSTPVVPPTLVVAATSTPFPADSTPPVLPNVPTPDPIFGQGPPFSLSSINITPDPPLPGVDNLVTVLLTNPSAGDILVDAEIQLAPLGIGQPVWVPIGRVTALPLAAHTSVVLEAVWFPTSSGHRCARVVVNYQPASAAAGLAARTPAELRDRQKINISLMVHAG